MTTPEPIGPGSSAGALYRISGAILEVTTDGGATVHGIAFDFPFVSALRWVRTTRSVLVCATWPGRTEPDRSGRRGDRWLGSWDVDDEASWRVLHKGYANDPVVLATGDIAVHRGAGITFLSPEGRVLREHKVGKFNWGVPALSAHRHGDVVAWLRYRGDDALICAESLDGSLSRQYAVSCGRYAWLDESHLVYYKGGSLRVLDLTTGRHRALARPGLAFASPGLPAGAARFEGVPTSLYHGSRVVVRPDALYFTARFQSFDPPVPPYFALFSADPDGSN